MLKSALELQFVSQFNDSLKYPPSLCGYSDLFLTKENQDKQSEYPRVSPIAGKSLREYHKKNIDILKQRQSVLIAQNERCQQMYQDALDVTRDVHAAWMSIANKNNGFGSLRETLTLIDQFRERLDICVEKIKPIEEFILSMSEKVREKQQNEFISLKEKEVSDFKLKCEKEYSEKHNQILEKRQHLLETYEKEREKKRKQLEAKAKSEIEEYLKSGNVPRFVPETENSESFVENDVFDKNQSNDEIFSDVPSSDGWEECDDVREEEQNSNEQQQEKKISKVVHQLVTEIEPE